MTSMISIDQLIHRMKEQNFSPIYFLSGNDICIQDYLINLIEGFYLKNGGRKFTLTPGDDPPHLLLDELNSISLFDDRRIIIIRQIQKLPAKGRDELLDYLNHCSREICLLVISDNYYDKNKFKDQIKSKSVILDVRTPVNRQKTKDWVYTILKQKKIQITGDALEMIIDRTGSSISNIINEITIVWLMMRCQGEISMQKVNEMVSEGMNYPIWRYLDALGRKNMDRSIKILKSLLDYNSQVPQITSNLATFMEKLYWIRNNKNTVIPRFGMNQTLARNLTSYARLFSKNELLNIFKEIRNIDILSKSTNLSPINLLLPITIRTCNEEYARL